MTPEKLRRLAALQACERIPDILPSERNELAALRRELAASPEVADNPATPFTDESWRPQLDGTDYGVEQRKRDCDEARAWLEGFAARIGRAAAEAAIAAAMVSIRR